MDAGVAWGFAGTVLGAALGAGATIYASARAERARRRAEARQREDDVRLALETRLADEEAKDSESRRYEARHWISYAAEVRQVTSAALQEFERNVRQLGQPGAREARWPYLSVLGDVTHQAGNLGREARDVVDALWGFSTELRNAMTEFQELERRSPLLAGATDHRAREIATLTSAFNNAKAARTELIRLLADRTKEHGYVMPGRPEDW
jgi:hypothetical protein